MNQAPEYTIWAVLDFLFICGDIRSSMCTTGVVAAGVVDTGGASRRANISVNFRKNRNDPPVIFRGLGKGDS
jgi:hypothetical protein